MSKDNDAPDPIRARWFGAPWNAPICSESPALAPPTHLACVYRLTDIMPADEIDRFLPDDE